MWSLLTGRLRQTIVPAQTLAAWLRESGGSAHPAELGIGLAKLAADYRRARLIRRRYTVLDCLEDLGMLDEAVDALFAADGFWRRQPLP